MQNILARPTPEIVTPYTLWSQGRLLGQSELDYARVLPASRMGAFVPTEFGETLMPFGAAVELELRGSDGTLIPIQSLSIQDTEILLAFAPEAELECDGDAESRLTNGPGAPPLMDAYDAELFEDTDFDDPEADFRAATAESWADPVLPRYQIRVDLINEWSIP